jgi:aromatic ring-opening dioxygenase catalytic subunit (LigB family)
MGSLQLLPLYAFISAQQLRDFSQLYRLDGVNTPKAIVVVSAHWVTSGQKVRVSSQKQHTKLLYDYGGFPPHTYKLEYNPPGSPALSQRIVDLLQAGGVAAEVDTQWNFDHGVFIPLKMIYPDATIPVVEISIDRSYDPAFHVKVGRALAALKREGVLLIASGSSTHNFSAVAAHSKKFMEALQKILEDRTLSVDERTRLAALDWQKIPSARQAHPEEDHFVPLFVALGAAEDQQAKMVGKVHPAGDWHCASFLFDSPQ